MQVTEIPTGRQVSSKTMLYSYTTLLLMATPTEVKNMSIQYFNPLSIATLLRNMESIR